MSTTLSNKLCWRVESQPHWFDSHVSLSLGWRGDLFAECQKRIGYHKTCLLIESLVCLSMSISYLSFATYDFHSCHCTCVERCSLVSKKGGVPIFGKIQKEKKEKRKKDSLFLFVNVHRLSQLSIRARDSEYVVKICAKDYLQFALEFHLLHRYVPVEEDILNILGALKVYVNHRGWFRI